MHGTPVGVIGVILVKHMVFSIIIGKSVGVVHPAHTGGQVQGGASLRGNKTLLFLLINSGVS
jgi:hypothetical protein